MELRSSLAIWFLALARTSRLDVCQENVEAQGDRSSMAWKKPELAQEHRQKAGTPSQWDASDPLSCQPDWQ